MFLIWIDKVLNYFFISEKNEGEDASETKKILPFNLSKNQLEEKLNKKKKQKSEEYQDKGYY